MTSLTERNSCSDDEQRCCFLLAVHQVVYVLNVTDKSAREVCEFHQFCDAQSNDTLVTSTHASHRPAPVAPPRVRPQKQDMLRIAHITDIHFDQLYSEVYLCLDLTFAFAPTFKMTLEASDLWLVSSEGSS